MEFLACILVMTTVLSSGSYAASLVGSESYYKILSIGSEEKQGLSEINREMLYLKSDLNPYAVQEVKTRIAVSCFVEARHIEGEVFAATCPPGCDQFSNRVWGSGVYMENSCFCAAAIHDGVITAKRGGVVTVRKIEGKSSYTGANRNGITSLSYGEGQRSFIFQNAGKARRPTYEVSCVVQASWIKETDFNVVCPGGCEEVIEKLWGDGTYSEESYICAAAVHGGKADGTMGGEVHVIKSGYQATFKGTTKNGIESLGSSIEQDSFKLEEMKEKTTSVLEVSCYFRADHVVEEQFAVLCPPGCDSVSDQVTGTGIYTQDSFLCASAIHAGHIHAAMGGLVTVFKTAGNINFVGSLQKGITSRSSEHRNASSFLFQKSTTREPSIVTVSCEIRGSDLMDDVATIMCPGNCDHVPYSVWGTDTYKADSTICAAAAHAGIIDVSLGGPVTVKRVSGLEEYKGGIHQRIISQSFGKTETAFTFADNIQMVDSVLAVPCDFSADLISDDFFSLKCPPRCMQGTSKVWGDGIYTSDSPLCLAAIHAGLVECSLGGKITVHKVKGRATYSASKRNEIQSFEYGSWSSASVVFQRACPETESLYPVTCGTRANFMVDDSFTVVCPAGCDVESNEIWGTGVYTDDSFVCGAAIHDGRIPADVGGQVTVGKVPGMDAYTGSTQNTIETGTKGRWRKSIVFKDTILQRMSTFTITCDVEGGMIQDEEFSVVCPPGCVEETERVWGSDIYTEDSYICAAAIHAGKFEGKAGGLVTVAAIEAENFQSTTRNDIESKSYDKSASAFKFL